MHDIYFCQMTQDRLSETAECLELYLPWITKAIIIDGGSIDDSIPYFRNWSQLEPKIEFHIHPWRDQFSEQRNNYLSYVPDNSWVLVSDPDEVFLPETLQKLQKAIERAEEKGKDMVGFQCRSVSYKGPERVHESLDNYWKRLLFKKYPGTKYAGQPHEHLENHPLQIMDTNLIYEHRKQENVIWVRGARNYFCGGGGPNLGSSNPFWQKLVSLCCDKANICGWHEFQKYCLQGNIDAAIKEEFVKYINLTEIFPGQTDGLSEMRECYKTYFRLWHPEEEPDELRSRVIP